MTHRPALLAEIAKVAGDDAAIKVAQARGGTRVYFPPKPAKDHWLVDLVGQQRADAICEELTAGIGPVRVDVPIGTAGQAGRGARKVDRLIREGKSERDIALATGYTERAVRWRKRRMKDMRDTRQQDLF